MSLNRKAGCYEANPGPGSQVNQAQGGWKEVKLERPGSTSDLKESSVTEAFRLFPGHTLSLRCIKTSKLRDQVGNCYLSLELRKEV